jgi:ferredoxin
MMRVHVDRNVCTGAGTCELVAPGVFALDADERATVLLEDEVPAELEPFVVLAERACPTGAISVEDD